MAAAVLATQTVEGYFKRRAAERKSDLAVDILAAMYRYESELKRVRSVSEWLATFDAQKPHISEFQISVQKIEAYDKWFSSLEPLYSRLIELVPVVRAVFGDVLEAALGVIAHTYDRIFAAKEGIREYNIQGQNYMLLGEEFTGWDIDGVKIGPEQIGYYWKTLLADEADTAEMQKQMALARDSIEKILFPIVRMPIKGR